MEYTWLCWQGSDAKSLQVPVTSAYLALPAAGDKCAGCDSDVPIRNWDVGRMLGNKTADACLRRASVVKLNKALYPLGR